MLKFCLCARAELSHVTQQPFTFPLCAMTVQRLDKQLAKSALATLEKCSMLLLSLAVYQPEPCLFAYSKRDG